MTATKGFVVPAGGGKHFDSPTPGRSFALKLLGRETNESIMMFEETLPAGTASLFHLHRGTGFPARSTREHHPSSGLVESGVRRLGRRPR